MSWLDGILGISSLVLAGDVTGSSGANSVDKIHGVTTPVAAPSAGQYLKASSPTVSAWGSISGTDLPAAGTDLANTLADAHVVGIGTGVSTVPVHANSLTWDAGTTPTIGMVQRSSDAACADIQYLPQRPWASATGSNRVPGNFVVDVGAPTNGGTTEAGFLVKRAGSLQCQIGNYSGGGSNVALWFGSGIAPTNNNFAFLGDGSGSTYLNAPVGGTVFITTNGTAGNGIGVTATTVYFPEGQASGVYGIAARTSDVATNALTVTGQNAWGSAVTHTAGGTLTLQSGTNTNGSTVSVIGLTPTSISANLSGTTFFNATGNSTKFAKAYAGTITTLTYGTTIAVDASLGNSFLIVPTDGVAFTISNPTNGTDGQRIRFRIKNQRGGGNPLGAVTWGTKYKKSTNSPPTTQPADTFSSFVDFEYKSADDLWYQCSMLLADIAN